MVYLALTLIAVAALLLIWQRRRGPKAPDELPEVAYTCHRCGEKHCECQRSSQP